MRTCKFALIFGFIKSLTMKKYFLLVVFFLFAKLGSAQYSLVFCEDVNSEGKPEMVSNSFMVDGDGGVLKFLLKTEDYFNTDKLDFRVFYLSEEGTEEEISRLPQRVLPTWNFAWKEMVMFDPGNYRVKVFTGSGTYLTSANLNVRSR